jgi:hypothetical protein
VLDEERTTALALDLATGVEARRARADDRDVDPPRLHHRSDFAPQPTSRTAVPSRRPTGGASVEVPVVIEQCTATGRIGAGVTVRLVLRLDGSLAEMPCEVELAGGGAPGLVIEIEAT